MIIIGAYPEILSSAGAPLPLRSAKPLYEKTVPTDAYLHLLPPYPSAGDEGFAPNDWFTIRNELGPLEDIRHLAASRKLILDGIYNHVGTDHHFVRDFFGNPKANSPLYAFREQEVTTDQLSPRGGSVFRDYETEHGTFKVWQTFSPVSFDINISNQEVFVEILRHLDFLSQNGCSGVRLDGCAYYGHEIGAEQFHHPKGIKLTQTLAREAIKRGLFVIAQLDSDPEGSAYFLRANGWNVPVVDYAFTAVLVRAILGENADALALHFNRSSMPLANLLRPPRTHDGILLQSDTLLESELVDIYDISKRWSLATRITNGEIYELNSSLPFICSLGVTRQQFLSRILQVIAITGFFPGIPYFYLPFITGHIPERSECDRTESDPRALNRTRLNETFLNNFCASKQFRRLTKLLDIIQKIKEEPGEEQINCTVFPCKSGNSRILFSYPEEKYKLYCNLSTTSQWSTPIDHKDQIVFKSSSINPNIVEACGFILTRSRDWA